MASGYDAPMNNELSAHLDPAAVARVPTQQRAIDRFEAVLAEAEAVLVESGLAGFSIPVIAERLNMTRGSVYAYFPTPFAILNELVGRYLNQIEDLFMQRGAELARLSWQDSIRLVVDFTASYHNSHPAARLLILGGAVTDASYRAQEMLMKRLGGMARAVWLNHLEPGQRIPQSPDIATLVADLGVTCFRRSFFEHGEITAEYREAAVVAMQSFLSSYIETMPARE